MTNHTGHGHAATTAARTACRKAELVALADAVDARRRLIAHRAVRRDNNPTWRRLSREVMAAEKVYAGLTGMDLKDVATKVREISEIPIVD